MEKGIKINAKDKIVIHGTLKEVEDSDKLIILVHGLTDYQNNHLFFNARKFFSDNGFSVFTFDLYSWEKDARKFKNCTLQTNSQDLNTVLDYFKEKFSNIYLVGHSMGAPTILLSNYEVVNSIVFWDPSYDFEKFMKMISKFDEGLGVHILDGAYEIIVRDKMYKSLTTEFPDCFKLVKKLNKPLKIIAAGKGLLLEGAEKYLEVANEPKELKVIDGATHCFDEDGKETMLFDETLSWVAKF